MPHGVTGRGPVGLALLAGCAVPGPRGPDGRAARAGLRGAPVGGPVGRAARRGGRGQRGRRGVEGPGRSRRIRCPTGRLGSPCTGAPGRAACRAQPVLLTAAAASSANPDLRDDLARVLGWLRTAEWSCRRCRQRPVRADVPGRWSRRRRPERRPRRRRPPSRIGQTRYPKGPLSSEESNRQATTTPLFGRASRPRQVPVSVDVPNPASPTVIGWASPAGQHRPHPAAASYPRRQHPNRTPTGHADRDRCARSGRHPQPRSLPTGARPDRTLDFRPVQPVMTERRSASHARKAWSRWCCTPPRKGVVLVALHVAE